MGAARAPAAETLADAERSTAGVLGAAGIQQALRDPLRTRALASEVDLVAVDPALERSAVAASDFRMLADVADTVLIAGFTEIGAFRTQGDALALKAKTHVRSVRTLDNAELFEADGRYSGGAETVEAWSADDGHRLLEALANLYRQQAGQIVDGMFLLYPFPDRAPHGASFMASAFGLAPLEPRNRGQLSGDPLVGNAFEWTRVSSRAPTLRWQSFPRAVDTRREPEPMSRVRDVRYDLVIARERGMAPAEIVYERQGLPTPVHRVETPLAADARFFWTVRARFELDGRERVSEWSATHGQAANDELSVPSRACFRFRTP